MVLFTHWSLWTGSHILVQFGNNYPTHMHKGKSDPSVCLSVVCKIFSTFMVLALFMTSKHTRKQPYMYLPQNRLEHFNSMYFQLSLIIQSSLSAIFMVQQQLSTGTTCLQYTAHKLRWPPLWYITAILS